MVTSELLCLLASLAQVFVSPFSLLKRLWLARRALVEPFYRPDSLNQRYSFGAANMIRSLPRWCWTKYWWVRALFVLIGIWMLEWSKIDRQMLNIGQLDLYGCSSYELVKLVYCTAGWLWSVGEWGCLCFGYIRIWNICIVLPTIAPSLLTIGNISAICSEVIVRTNLQTSFLTPPADSYYSTYAILPTRCVTRSLSISMGAFFRSFSYKYLDSFSSIFIHSSPMSC